MALHPNSVLLKGYFAKKIKEIIRPLAEVEWQLWHDEEACYGVSALSEFWYDKEQARGGITILADEFLTITGYLIWCSTGPRASSEGLFAWDEPDWIISGKEIAFYADVVTLLKPAQTFTLDTVQTLVKMVDEVMHDDPDRFCDIASVDSIEMLKEYDVVHSTNYAQMAKGMFYVYAHFMLQADGEVTRRKIGALNEFKDLLHPPQPASVVNTTPAYTTAKPQPTPAKAEPAKELGRYLDELNALVGLSNIKSDVTQLVNFLKVQQMRQSKGLPSVPITRHLVFSGNPGTGKTSVARLIAQIYQSLGILSKGHMIETDRSGLVGGYLGQTALKVKEVVAQALGGVLFIDEAYALTNDRQDEYGKEAIDTLLKLMEDNRDNLIVVVAGYTDKMDKFLLSNPGLKSRFNKFFTFHDYTPSELVSIFEGFCQKVGFVIQPSAQAKLLRLFHAHHATRDDTFGNGRLARNLFEQALNNQANRIVSLYHINEMALSTIEPADILNSAELETEALFGV